MNIRLSAGCPRLAVIDFDRTTANTFVGLTPNIHGVEEASRMAIEAIFGEAGVIALNAIGGPGNRSPRELIKALVEAGDRVMLFSAGLGYLSRHRTELMACMPEGKGRPLGIAPAPSVELMTEIFVCAKLLILNPQVSKEWPKAYPGYFDCLELLRDEEIGHGILSAGHETFIGRFFMANGVTPPRMVTDDDIRGGPLEGCTKPDIRLFRFCIDKIARMERIPSERVLIVGDDIERDGHMARDAGAQFGWFNSEGKKPNLPLWDGAFEFRHYDELKGAFEDAILTDRVR